MNMNRNNKQADEPEEWEEAGFEVPPWLEFERAEGPEAPVPAGGSDPNFSLAEEAPETANESEAALTESREPFPADHPVQFADDLKNVYDLEESLNAYGRTIYVETWEETTGKPRVWYEFNKQKILVKYVRGPSSITHAYLGKTKYI